MYCNTMPDRGSKTLPTLYTKPEMPTLHWCRNPLESIKIWSHAINLSWHGYWRELVPYLVSNPLTLGTNLIWHFYLGITHSDPCNNKLQHSHTVVMHGDRPSNQTAWRGKHTCPNSSCRRVAVWCKASNVLINEEKSEKKLALVKYKQIKKSIMKDVPDLK